MTGQDVLGEPSHCHFAFITHCRDGVIFYPYILHNDGCHGLHDDDDWTCKSVGMDSSAIAAAQTEGEIKSKVAKKTQVKKKIKIKKCIISTN